MSKRSVVWLHFSKPEREGDGRQTVCRWCKEKFSFLGSTTNLMNHLKRKHPGIDLEIRNDETSRPTDCTAKTKQTKLDFRGAMTASKQEKITDLITDFIVKDMRPIAIVEGEHFRKLVSYIEPKYEMPSRRTFGRRIETMFAQSKTELQADLTTVSCLALTFDGWTSISMEAYLGVTAHFLNESFNLQSCLLGCKPLNERHTADNIVWRIEEILQEFDINPSIVSGAVSDNGANMRAAKQILNTKFGWYSIGCTAHSLQLCLNHGLQIPSIQKSLGAAKQVINHFKQSELATSALKKKCEEMQVTFKKLIIEVNTRWNSTFLMVERLVEMQWPVMAVLSDQNVITPLKAKSLSPKPSDWDVMRRLIPILQPFAEATDSLGAEKFVSISLRNPYIKGLKKHLIKKACEESAPIKQFCETVIEQMASRFESIAVGVTWKATALDPRYKLRGLSSVEAIQLRSALEVELAQTVGTEDHPSSSTPTEAAMSQSIPGSALKNLVDMAFESAESSDTSSDAENVCSEISEFFSEKRITDDENPLEWWGKNRRRFPNLAKLAVKFMCIPATSTPSERVFSTAGNTISTLCSSLTGKHVEALVFLKCNW